MRYAIYFTPGPSDALTRTASQWLGRDAFSREAIAHKAHGKLSAAEVAGITSSPGRYGFHATLKAPFRLSAKETEASLVAALEAFASASEPFEVPQMVVGNLGGFFAIIPSETNEALDQFAGQVVSGFEKFRSPLTEADIARRSPDHLSPAELQNLHDWGYPYVFESFRFHMTLSNRVPLQERDKIAVELEALFGPLLARPFAIDGLALFVEPEPGAPFHVHSLFPLGSAAERKTA
ncbi:DUF1045 domain-containing protein [Pelagibacterium lentulum]|uniref:Phosphonate metabolism protein n=1 Tax=Pelagibacterium lentulum TaxID=2029865 RepID=A0A916R5J4_9HYPH|nr:DUF1045 domain-containing protein [Pelagibacterium lentulum]GGA38978.1 phosphonate metabolism protein [Pelagibacterium lentulum]